MLDITHKILTLKLNLTFIKLKKKVIHSLKLKKKVIPFLTWL